MIKQKNSTTKISKDFKNAYNNFKKHQSREARLQSEEDFLNSLQIRMDRKTGQPVAYDVSGHPVNNHELDKLLYGNQTDQGWLKMWPYQLMLTCGQMSIRQVSLVIIIFNSATYTKNLFIGSVRNIAQQYQTSQYLAEQTIKKLRENHIIAKIKPSVYMVNPAIVWRGTPAGRKHAKKVFSKADGHIDFDEWNINREILALAKKEVTKINKKTNKNTKKSLPNSKPNK